MRLAATLLVLIAAALAWPAPVRAGSEAALVDGFMRTVFGSEFGGWAWQSGIAKKFTGPVRVQIEDRSEVRDASEAVAFIGSLPHLIRGLDLAFVEDAAAANFRVFIIDRADYRRVVTREIYGRPSSGFAPGKCLVRVVSGRNGITRSDAVIVADEGDFLFRRCLVEEVLQGLGPVNDDPTLADSVFNDTSRHARFTHFDRQILNMLYDRRIRHGMSRSDAERVLPAVAAEVRRRLR